MRSFQPKVKMVEGSYMIVFGSQKQVNVPKDSHTFAGFVRVFQNDTVGTAHAEQNEISWLPKSKRIRLNRPPEEGANFGLKDTLNWVQDEVKAKITAWGPFRIKTLLYQKALTRIAELEAGSIEYVVLDRFYRPHRATNCIHALSDLGLPKPPLWTGVAHGRNASRMVTRYLSDWIVDPSRTYMWVAHVLGLGEYKIDYESLELS